MLLAAGSIGLQDLYRSEAEAIRKRFDGSRNGQAAIRERSDLIDTVITQLWNGDREVAAGSERLCVIALGGYGRRALFPYSDVDLLFLFDSAHGGKLPKQGIRKVCQALLDLDFCVRPTTRTL